MNLNDGFDKENSFAPKVLTVLRSQRPTRIFLTFSLIFYVTYKTAHFVAFPFNSFICQTRDSFSGFGLPFSLKGKLKTLLFLCPVCSSEITVSPAAAGNISQEAGCLL